MNALRRPRIMRSLDDKPLTPELIKGCAPAVFMKKPYEGMSEQYAYIPTYKILESLLNEGFHVYEVAQARPYQKDRDPYAKHMLRLRPPVTKKVKKFGDIVPELVLVNAHDGSARYYLYAALYRLICSNGMMTGNEFYSLNIMHKGVDTARKVLEGSYKIVQEEFPRMITTVEEMKAITLKPAQQLVLAERAMALRYQGVISPFPAQELLTARRTEDEGNALWSVFNRIQENVTMGGVHGRAIFSGRRETMRPIERVNSIVNINRGLWDAATELMPLQKAA